MDEEKLTKIFTILTEINSSLNPSLIMNIISDIVDLNCKVVDKKTNPKIITKFKSLKQSINNIYNIILQTSDSIQGIIKLLKESTISTSSINQSIKGSTAFEAKTEDFTLVKKRMEKI